MKELDICKQMARMLSFLVLSILFCKLTNGYGIVLLAVIGVGCAASNKLGWALVYFVLLPFFVVLNPAILPKGAFVIGCALRFGPLLIGLCLAMGGMSRKGRHRLPFIGILPFLCAAVISSAGGWAPSVSYMKLINFGVFLFGIWYGTQNLQHRPEDVFLLRGFMLALSALLIIGSILLIPFPGISYATSLQSAMKEGGSELAHEVFEVMKAEGMKTLFCGITNHSQALSPLLACSLTWVTCDMLFLERRFRKLHLVLMALSFPLLYMTRSRVALISSLFALGLIFVYTTRIVQLPQQVKARLNAGFFGGMCLIFIVAVVLQMKSGLISEWARKTDEGKSDNRSLAEAMTSSRMGLVDESLRDFRRNPLLGSGFQVAEYTRSMTKGKGLILSASIEKGVLPVMVLGETGILGEALFLAFLASFFMTCSRRKCYITITMFAVLLVTNLGEATFFSPGGMGGILWMMSCVGGFAIDTTILYRKNIMQTWADMARMEAERREQVEATRRRLGIG